MSNNDLISRSHFDDRVRLAAGPDADEEFSADFLDGVKTVLYMLSTEPAVQQEMSAREYAKAKWQMCKSAFYCENCPMIVWRDLDDSRSCSEWAAKYPEKAVAIVEKWAREHPEERSEEQHE